jgi:hypothetical protein
VSLAGVELSNDVVDLYVGRDVDLRAVVINALAVH